MKLFNKTIQTMILIFLFFAIASCFPKTGYFAENSPITGWLFFTNDSCVFVIDQPLETSGQVFSFTMENCPIQNAKIPTSTTVEITEQAETNLQSKELIAFFDEDGKLSISEPFIVFKESGDISWFIPVKRSGIITGIMELDDQNLEILSLRNTPAQLFILSEYDAKKIAADKLNQDISFFQTGHYMASSISQIRR